jgi:hypothetical protein
MPRPPFTQTDSIPFLLRCIVLIVSVSSFNLQADDHDEDQLGSWDALVPEKGDPPINWLDNSHSYLTNQTQSLAGWMDAFFGDSAHDADKAESYLRVEFIEDFRSIESNKSKVKVRGRVQLPRMSKRLSLVFNGEDGEDGKDGQFVEDSFDRNTDDSIGLQFRRSESSKARFDYTLGYSSGHLKPGIRYRREAPLGEKYSYRLIERIQYEHGENFFSRTQFRLSRRITDNRLVSWGNKLTYGERTEGVDWSTNISYRTRYRVDRSRPIAVSYFTSIGGVTRPDDYIYNYNFGLLFRRQVYRDFLFLELEPTINFRKTEASADRESLWRFVVRLEIALQKDLQRMK